MIEFRCISCQHIDNYKNDRAVCKSCDRKGKLTSMVGIPWCRGTVPGEGTGGRLREKPKVPINIIDQMPNGTTKVTRIGTTDQEEGS